MKPGRADVLGRLFKRLYGDPVVRNDLRGELVEEIVGMALAPDWQLCGADWGACDLRHDKSGLKIQVKQSAAKQSWASSDGQHSSPRFSIAAKTGHYEGAEWIAGESRNADIFIFAWNGVIGDGCDHADPAQWQFYVIAETALPAQKSLGLRQIERLTASVEFIALATAVQAVMCKNFKIGEELAQPVTL